MNLAAEIRAELARQNITYADFAKRIGTSRQVISQKIGREKARITNEDLVTYANELNVPASEFMRRAEERSQVSVA